MLFIEKKLFLRMGEKCLGFIFIGLVEVLTSCLHTRLRDQTPCSSLSKTFLWVLIGFNFWKKMVLKKRTM